MTAQLPSNRWYLRACHALYLTKVILTTLWVGLTILIIVWFDRRLKLVTPLARYWCGALLRFANVHVIEDTQKLASLSNQGPYIVMANHESLIDPGLLFWKLPLNLKAVAKKSLFYVPIVGQVMSAMGHISIDRRNKTKAIASLKRAAKKINRGASVLIFPEGQRAETANAALLPFKKGSFYLALEAGVPILPIGIAGTATLLSKGSGRIDPGNIAYCIGTPIPTDNILPSEKEQLVAKVYDAITSLREQAQGVLKQHG